MNYDKTYSEFKQFKESIAYNKYSIREFLIKVIELNKKKFFKHYLINKTPYFFLFFCA